MPSISKTQRWLDLIAYLVGRRVPVVVEDLMERIPAYADDWVGGDDTARDSVRRKFERDKDELKALGIPLESVEYRINYQPAQGYRLASRDFYLPYLRILAHAEEDAPAGVGGPAAPASPSPSAPAGVDTFDVHPSELRAAADALRDLADLPGSPLAREARSAFRKLTFDLAPEPGTVPPAGDAAIRFLDPPDAPGDTSERDATLHDLSDAVLRQKRVTFDYYGIHRDAHTHRTVQPWGLLFQHSHWYLVGHDEDRDDLRVFRVGRMSGLEVNTRRAKSPDFDVPDDFSLDDFTDREAWELGDPEEEPVEVRVRFPFPRSLWAARNDHGTLVEEEDDGTAVRTFRVRQVDPFLRWMLSLEGEATVESPPEMALRLRELARTVAGIHAPADPGPSSADAPFGPVDPDAHGEG